MFEFLLYFAHGMRLRNSFNTYICICIYISMYRRMFIIQDTFTSAISSEGIIARNDLLDLLRGIWHTRKRKRKKKKVSSNKRERLVLNNCIR